MRRLKHVLLILPLLVGLHIAPISAQEATPEAQPDVPVAIEDNTTVVDSPEGNSTVIVQNQNPVLVIALAIVGVLLAISHAQQAVLAAQLRKMIPPEVYKELQFARPRIQARVDQGFDWLDAMTEATTNPLDDMLSRFGRERVNGWIAAFYGDEVPSSGAARDSPSNPY